MRPEYIQAIDAVRYGYTLWLPFLAAIPIWIAAIPGKRALKAFLLAWAVCWFLSVHHSNAIQAAKGKHKLTNAELQDWSRDSWNTFAPLSAIAFSFVYCSANAAVAYMLVGAGRKIARVLYHPEKPSDKSKFDSHLTL